MNIYIISIFPDIFTSFFQTSLLDKAQKRGLLKVSYVNPRDFCLDKNKQVDSAVYGGGKGMLLKAQPIIDAVNSVIQELYSQEWAIIYPSPSKTFFTQKYAHFFSKLDALIFVCGRYEGIDARWEYYFLDRYPNRVYKLSIGEFVTMGGEVPSMAMIEAISRLIPGVIKESESREKESYSLTKEYLYIEGPQYTKPITVYGYTIPKHSKKK